MSEGSSVSKEPDSSVGHFEDDGFKGDEGNDMTSGMEDVEGWEVSEVESGGIDWTSRVEEMKGCGSSKADGLPGFFLRTS